MAVLLFCQCGSDRVDIRMWNGDRGQLACLTCGKTSWLDGFTISEFDPSKLLVSALVDQARNHRRQTPNQARAVEDQRKAK